MQVFDQDVTSDDCLGEREIDLKKQYFSEALDGSTWVQAVMLDLVKDGRLQGSVKLAFCKVPFVIPAGNSEQMLSPAPKAKTSFVGQLHVKVFKIEGFADSAGMMDKTDPYVSATMGKSTKKTSVKVSPISIDCCLNLEGHERDVPFPMCSFRLSLPYSRTPVERPNSTRS